MESDPQPQVDGEQQPPTDTVPVFTHLDMIYKDDGHGSLKKHEKRFQNLKDRFKQIHGVEPKFYGRAPGRVNIIGEHIDYCGYSVLPAALEQDFLMAYVTVPEGEEGAEEIDISNIDKDTYPREKISTDPFQKLLETADWRNYFLCGYKAILAHNAEIRGHLGGKAPVGMKIMIDSHVPPAAGLSSSSAFCVCAAVTTMHANGLTQHISKQLLSDLTITAERMAGTACGGMDQTISVMGEKGVAKHIEFIPEIKCHDVTIPDSVCLVIGNSCTPSPKLLTLGTRYNKRVVECRFCVAAMAIKAGKCDQFDACTFSTFLDLQTELGYTLEQMLELAESSFSSKGEYTPEKISTEFNVEDPFKLVASVSHVTEVKSRNASFELYKRAHHVLTEAKRVLDFKATCNDASLDEETKVNKLGALMTESHLSCDMYYDCSSPELNELTTLARESGALGSRLTGAGWGGCCVSLVKKDALEGFIDKVYSYFTKERPIGEQLWITDDLDRYIFATQPAQGACVVDPQYALWQM